MSFPAHPPSASTKTRLEFTRKAILETLLLVLPSGWGGREVGGVWEIMVTAPLFFPTLPSRGRSKPGQESSRQLQPTHQLTSVEKLRLSIEPGCVQEPQAAA